MFEHLKNKRILVTGPQRSGTTICARMIAHDADLEYIDEDRIGVDDLALVHDLFASRKDFVLQAPGVAHACHRVDADVVVFMVRKVDDIIESQERIKWGCESIELEKYKTGTGPIAKAKYDKWKDQGWAIKMPIEVNFNDLASHPLWVADRSEFSARQWKREQ